MFYAIPGTQVLWRLLLKSLLTSLSLSPRMHTGNEWVVEIVEINNNPTMKKKSEKSFHNIPKPLTVSFTLTEDCEPGVEVMSQVS